MFKTYKKHIHRIIKRRYAVNSGVYSVISPSVMYKLDKYGEYQPIFTKALSNQEYEKLASVDMMSDFSESETEISNRLYGQNKGIQFDQQLGYYTSLYVGYVKSGNYRDNGSSGGMTSWIISELKRRKMIDGVIHMKEVDPRENDGVLFKYGISYTLKEIQSNAKSRYYPGNLAEVLQEVKRQKNKKFAVVGIPEYITEIKLLSSVDKDIANRIVYTIGLVCGHQKSAKYVESLAWQFGIKPGALTSVDFRVKQPEDTAVNYLHKFSGRVDGKEVELFKTHEELFGEFWAHGFFKTKFSDFTDNVFNENADIVLGDAWIPKYNQDGRGNNIVIVRSPEIDAIIKESKDELQLDSVDSETIKSSQRGLIHHAQDELPYRIQRIWPKWTPKKRYTKPVIARLKKPIQDIRSKIVEDSRSVYQEALRRGDWSYFKKRMQKNIQIYDRLYDKLRHQEKVDKDLANKAPLQRIVSRVRMALRLRTRLKQLKSKVRVRTRARAVIRKIYDKKEAKLLRGIVNKSDGGILTLNGYFNYGNILQRYSLQRYVYNHGYSFVSLEKGPLDKRPDTTGRMEFTKRFVENRIACVPFEGQGNLDSYIVGSDQVWRRWGEGKEGNPYRDLKDYMFNFVRNKKSNRIAYAASFGCEKIEDARLTPEIMDELKPLAQRIDHVSVRETSAVNIAKEYWGIDAELVLDPVFLLDKKHYSKLIRYHTSEVRPSNPIFGYLLDASTFKKDAINRIVTSPSEIYYLNHIQKLPPVEQWLKNIRDAQLVITDSFHGVALSLIFNTPFIVLENTYGGVSRMESLLALVELEHLFVSNEKLESIDTFDVPNIDWVSVNDKLRTEIEQSELWLLDALKGRSN